MPSWPRSRARKSGASPQPRARGNCPATAAAGSSHACPIPDTGPGSGGRRRLADARRGAARGTLKDGPLSHLGGARQLIREEPERRSPRPQPQGTSRNPPPAARPGGRHGFSPALPWQHVPYQDVPCAPARRWRAPRTQLTGHEVLVACLKGLQPPVLVAVAFVVQAPAGGAGLSAQT